MGPTIRRVTPAEYDAVGALMLLVNRATYGEQAAPYEGFVTDIAARDREAEVLIACEGGAIVGAVAYVPDETSPLSDGLQPGEAGVRMLVVDPAHARRGIGSALTRACIERAREAGKARLVLHADTFHEPARGLYDALGFRLVPARDRPADDGTPLVCYVLDLTRSAS